MTNVFSDVLKYLKGTRDAVLPTTQSFAPLDVEALARQLRVDERAMVDATAGQPAVDSVEPTNAEREIRLELAKRLSRATEEYKAALATYNDRISRTLLSTDQSSAITAEGERILSNFESSMLHDTGELRLLEEELAARNAEFLAFRADNALHRNPHLASRNEILLRRILLGFAVVLESILNGMFFAKGSATGLVGGVLQASVLSLMNVLLAYSFARAGLPQLNHRSPFRKAVGIASVLIYALLLAALNLSVARFRDLYATNGGQVALEQLIAGLTGDPLGLQDVESLILAGLGTVLGVAAVIGAFGLDDPYPGYGAIGRRRRDALNAYVAARAACVNALERDKDAAVSTMIAAIDAIQSSAYDRNLASSGRDKLRRSFVDYRDHLIQINQLLIERYRQVNRRHRSAPPPAVFARPVEAPFPEDQTQPVTFAAVSDDLNSEVRARLDSYIMQLNERFKLALERYSTVDTVIERAS